MVARSQRVHLALDLDIDASEIHEVSRRLLELAELQLHFLA
jgi:hypothetical protein